MDDTAELNLWASSNTGHLSPDPAAPRTQRSRGLAPGGLLEYLGLSLCVSDKHILYRNHFPKSAVWNQERSWEEQVDLSTWAPSASCFTRTEKHLRKAAQRADERRTILNTLISPHGGSPSSFLFCWWRSRSSVCPICFPRCWKLLGGSEIAKTLQRPNKYRGKHAQHGRGRRSARWKGSFRPLGGSRNKLWTPRGRVERRRGSNSITS